MSDANALCYILVLAASIACVIYGFMDILRRKRASENDIEVIQRQIQGFGYLMLSHVVLIVGLALCLALNLEAAKKMFRSMY